MKHKVVAVSNFQSETVSDVLVCDNCTEYNAENIAKFFNQKYGEKHLYYFVVRLQDYKLFEAELC